MLIKNAKFGFVKSRFNCIRMWWLTAASIYIFKGGHKPCDNNQELCSQDYVKTFPYWLLAVLKSGLK